jgi:hypothetical protein
MADDSSTNPGTKISLWPYEKRRENARDKHCEFYNGYTSGHRVNAAE